MIVYRSYFARELFAAKNRVWESGPHVRFWPKLTENQYFFHVEEERRPLDHEKCKVETQMRGFGGADQFVQ